MSVKALDAGFPERGSPCRRVGETAATIEFLDDQSTLVACPGSRSSIFVTKFASAQNGRIVGYVDGVTLIAIPMRKLEAPHDAPSLSCTLVPGERPQPCTYFVVRRGGGISIVNITRPDGATRAVHFANGRVTGAEVKAPDGKASKRRVTSTREVDRFIVGFSGEHYEIPASALEAD